MDIGSLYPSSNQTALRALIIDSMVSDIKLMLIPYRDWYFKSQSLRSEYIMKEPDYGVDCHWHRVFDSGSSYICRYHVYDSLAATQRPSGVPSTIQLGGACKCGFNHVLSACDLACNYDIHPISNQQTLRSNAVFQTASHTQMVEKIIAYCMALTRHVRTSPMP